MRRLALMPTDPNEAARSVADISIHALPLADMRPVDLYGVLRVRQDVFIIEQDCPYPDLDGIDLLPDTVQHWISDDTGVVSTVRSYPGDGDGETHIGRVSTLKRARGRGYSRRLVDAAIRRLVEEFPGLPIQISAQAYLVDWYETFGFRVSGPGYLEDGIPHLPMVRPAEA